MPTLAQARDRMVETHLARRGIRDAAVLRAMRDVPREAFLDASLAELAYADTPLPIGQGQTISQPYVVALMIEAAGLERGERALEIGAGSGYAAAVMSRIAAQVYAIERHESLARQARERLSRIGCGNVQIRTGDGTSGWPEAAPFDVILVAAGGPDVPEALKRQLAVGGRLVMPVGAAGAMQTLVRLQRTGEDSYASTDLGAVRFVPLVGGLAQLPDGPGSGDSAAATRSDGDG